MTHTNRDDQLKWLSMAQNDFLGVPEDEREPVRRVLQYLSRLSEFPPSIGSNDDEGFLFPIRGKDWWIAQSTNGWDIFVRPVNKAHEDLRLEIGQILRDTVERRETRFSRKILDKLEELGEENDY